MPTHIQIAPFIPVALSYACHESLGFLVLPYDTLFSCEVTRPNKNDAWEATRAVRPDICLSPHANENIAIRQQPESGLCIISAPSAEDAERLFPFIGDNIHDITEQASAIEPFTLNTLRTFFDENLYLKTTIITSVTEHNGQSCQPSMLVRSPAEHNMDGNAYDFQANAQSCLRDVLQLVLFQTLVHNYIQESPHRRPRLQPSCPIDVEELLMLNIYNWFEEDRNPTPKRYQMTEGTINDRGPVRIAKIFDYGLQYGALTATPRTEPR